MKPIITDDYKIDVSKFVIQKYAQLKRHLIKKEFSKTNLCLIYQLLIRKLNTKEDIYFLRPSIYKLLNKNNLNKN